MDEFIFSKHAIEQIELRNIPRKLVDQVLNSPDNIIVERGKKIYQSIINFEEGESYLVRVFVNTEVQPNIIITAYRTSKIEKYYESKI